MSAEHEPFQVTIILAGVFICFLSYVTISYQHSKTPGFAKKYIFQSGQYRTIENNFSVVVQNNPQQTNTDPYPPLNIIASYIFIEAKPARKKVKKQDHAKNSIQENIVNHLYGLFSDLYGNP